MPAVSKYAKQRIIALSQESFRPCDIVKVLIHENIEVKDVTVRKIIKNWKETGSLERKPGCGRKKKVNVTLTRQL